MIDTDNDIDCYYLEQSKEQKQHKSLKPKEPKEPQPTGGSIRRRNFMNLDHPAGPGM
jgi:hypothetical protein